METTSKKYENIVPYDISRITNGINNYINQEDTDGALLINGSWGSGKTFFLKERFINPSITSVFKRLFKDKSDFKLASILFAIIYVIAVLVIVNTKEGFFSDVSDFSKNIIAVLISAGMLFILFLYDYIYKKTYHKYIYISLFGKSTAQDLIEEIKKQNNPLVSAISSVGAAIGLAVLCNLIPNLFETIYKFNLLGLTIKDYEMMFSLIIPISLSLIVFIIIKSLMLKKNRKNPEVYKLYGAYLISLFFAVLIFGISLNDIKLSGDFLIKDNWSLMGKFIGLTVCIVILIIFCYNLFRKVKGRRSYKQYIVVLDDLERTKIDMQTLLGIVNEYVDLKFKVIVVGDVNKINQDIESDIFKNYNEFKEKIIPYEIPFLINGSERYKVVMNSYDHNGDNKQYYEFLVDDKYSICWQKVLTDICKNNLRTLKKIVREFNYLYAIMSTKINKDYADVDDEKKSYFYSHFMMKFSICYCKEKIYNFSYPIEGGYPEKIEEESAFKEYFQNGRNAVIVTKSSYTITSFKDYIEKIVDSNLSTAQNG
jgi:hypothetical protein